MRFLRIVLFSRYLVKLTLPSGLLAIGEKAFSGCTSVTDINIPQTVGRIYDGASGTLKYIGKENFRTMNALTTLTMHDGLESTGESAFCVLLKFGSPYISESVLEIWQHAFNNMP